MVDEPPPVESEGDFETDDRRLCPDGACTGLLDESGVCKVCGLRGATGTATTADGGDAVDHRIEASEPSMSDAEIAEAEEFLDAFVATGPLDDERKLCPDGNCVGLIGDDGRCKVCGAVASESPDAS